MSGQPNSSPIPVAVARPGLVAQFPDAVVRADSTILVAYREGAGHLRCDGDIALVESGDGGRSWSPPWYAVEREHDARDPKLVVLRDGAILLSYFVLDWHADGSHTQLGTFVRRSRDGGHTWSAPSLVGSQLAWTATHGAIVERGDGQLLAPLYGAPSHGAFEQATVVPGHPDRLEFDPAREAVLVALPEAHCQEPTIVDLGDDGLAALVRTTAEYAYLTRSHDGGAHWTPPERTDLPASSHHTLRLANDSVLITYGDTSGRFSPRRATSGRIVPDPAGTWNGHPDVSLYDSGHDDQANPSSVELDGGFLTFSFDIEQGSIVAVRSAPADYLATPVT